MAKITAEQRRELEYAHDVDDEVFVEKLEEYTGITRKWRVEHDYYSENGDYVGCSEDFDLDTLLENAYVEVIDDV